MSSLGCMVELSRSIGCMVRVGLCMVIIFIGLYCLHDLIFSLINYSFILLNNAYYFKKVYYTKYVDFIKNTLYRVAYNS